MQTITLAQLHALSAAAPAAALVMVEVDGRPFEMFELTIEAGRAVLTVDDRRAPWEFTAEDFGDLLHNEFYTTPAVMPVFVRDLQGREFPVAKQLRMSGRGVAVVAGAGEIGAGTKVAALYATAHTRQRIGQGGH